MKQVYELNSLGILRIPRRQEIPPRWLRQGVPQGFVQDALHRLHSGQNTRGGRNQAEADFRLRAEERI